MHDIIRAKGINWNVPPRFTFRLRRTDQKFYQDRFGRIYSNRIAKMVETKDGVLENILKRICKYYDQFFVDEVQDFSGHDFNLLKQLCRSEVDINLVGDFFQHTFDTSKDGNINSTLYNSFDGYRQNFVNIGLEVDENTLSHSYRCTRQVCDFVKEGLGIDIQSHKSDNSNILFIDDADEIVRLFKCRNTVKLFYQNHSKYPCFSQNWGKSKGQDHYFDICIVLNPTTMKAYTKGKLAELAPSTRNKLYVACTRANNNIYFIDEKRIQNFIIKT